MSTQLRERHAPRLVATWLPIVIAVASFAISIYTLLAAARPPAVQAVLPQQIRLIQAAPPGAAYLYLQPTLVHTGRSEQVEVVQSMSLEITPPQGEPAAFTWGEMGQLHFDSATQATTYVYAGDAAPLLLSRQTAQSPFAVFNGPPGWQFGAGRYRADLVVQRAIAATPLRVAFSFELTDADVEVMNAAPGRRFVPTSIAPR